MIRQCARTHYNFQNIQQLRGPAMPLFGAHMSIAGASLVVGCWAGLWLLI
jgi:hypothetical protein